MRRSAHSALRRRIRATIAVAGFLVAILALFATSAEAATLPQGFADETVWSGLTNPVNLEFAPDGKVFVAEKGGEIKVFDSIVDPTPAAFGTGLAPAVHDFWDRGMLGLAIDPQFPTRPYVFVLYTYDHVLGSSSPPPRWGDGINKVPLGFAGVVETLSRRQVANRRQTGGEHSATNRQQPTPNDTKRQGQSDHHGIAAGHPTAVLVFARQLSEASMWHSS